jgi:polar amino acid transport system permease protein
MDAAVSIGLSKLQAILNVILAQSLRLVIPAWTNEVVYLVQYSSVVYLITVVELTGAGAIIGAHTFEYVAIYAIVAVVYLATTLAIVRTSHLIEFRSAIPGLTSSKSTRF